MEKEKENKNYNYRIVIEKKRNSLWGLEEYIVDRSKLLVMGGWNFPLIEDYERVFVFQNNGEHLLNFAFLFHW